MEADNAQIGAASMAAGLKAGPQASLPKSSLPKASLFESRWLSVPLGLASILAILPVAVLSFACYGAALVLEKISPLRDAYEFFSRAYDRVLERVGQKILRDPRDTPALRLMVTLSLTAVPIFVTQLILGKPRLLLVVAFYLSLYGSKFQRFISL